MEKRELLEAAARAAGMQDMKWVGSGLAKMIDPSRPESTGSIGPNWNPLTDDGDALRLAVKLSITLDFGGRSENVQAHVCANLPKKPRWWASAGPHWVMQEYVPEEMWATGMAEDIRFADWYLQNEPDVVKGLGAATRRVIVRAAAAIDAQRRESNG